MCSSAACSYQVWDILTRSKASKLVGSKVESVKTERHGNNTVKAGAREHSYWFCGDYISVLQLLQFEFSTSLIKIGHWRELFLKNQKSQSQKQSQKNKSNQTVSENIKVNLFRSDRFFTFV